MVKRYTDVEEQVQFGLDTIAPDRTIEVSLRDLMFVYQTLGLLINFFHQRLHYTDLQAIHRFLGNQDAGAYHLLHDSFYRKLRDVWPSDIIDAIDQGRFENPSPPYYYQSTDSCPE